MKDYVSELITIHEPKTMAEAFQHEGCNDVMQQEMDSIHKNNTWTLQLLLDGKRPIYSKWVYKKKYNAKGKVEKLKARIIDKGFEQLNGLDYMETFAPVIKWSTIRLVCMLASQCNWNINHWDIKTMFLHGELHEQIFRHQLKGFIKPWKEDLFCKLKKALYGLK
jgi:hypothetical protein